MFLGAATQHKKHFDGYIDRAGREVTLYLPAPVTKELTPAERVMGVRRGTPQETKTIRCVVTTDLIGSIDDAAVNTLISTLGKPYQLDAILRTKVSDAITDPDNPYGPTYFDKASEVHISGERFEITGTKRTGLPPLDPYVLWIGLRKGK